MAYPKGEFSRVLPESSALCALAVSARAVDTNAKGSAYPLQAEGQTPPRQSMELPRAVRQIRSSAITAWLSGLSQVCSTCHSLNLVAFRDLAASRGPRLFRGRSKSSRRDLSDRGRAERAGPDVQAARPAVRPFPAALRQPGGGQGGLRRSAARYVGPRQGARLPAAVPALHLRCRDGNIRSRGRIISSRSSTASRIRTTRTGTNIFPGHHIAMPKPLNDGAIKYTDGTAPTLANYSRDVAAFLFWAAEPKLEERKAMGFRVVIFLIVFAGLLYFTKKRIWSDVQGH